MKALCRAAIVALFALGCDGQQYVSPETVALVISTEGGAQRLNDCRYIPVLLGSRSSSHYTIDSRLEVRLDITREEIDVSFASVGEELEPFRVPSSLFEGSATEEAPAPPTGYTVALRSPCTP